MIRSLRARSRLAQIAQVRLEPPLGGCTRDTLRCADATSYQAELRSCCRKHLYQIVRDTTVLLEELKVTYWADYGTLLGAVRNPLTTWSDYHWLPQDNRPFGTLEPGVIPHDKDADFGFLFTDWARLMRVRAELGRRGYMVTVNPGGLKLKVRLSTVNYTGLDLFGWRERGSGVLYRPRYIQVDNFKGREFPNTKLFPRSVVEWEGIRLPAPSDPAAFCEFRYGPSWRIPIPANNDGVRR